MQFARALRARPSSFLLKFKFQKPHSVSQILDWQILSEVDFSKNAVELGLLGCQELGIYGQALALEHG